MTNSVYGDLIATPSKSSIYNDLAASLALYQYNACPFCVKVRRQMRRQSLHIQTVDAKQEEYKRQLENQGGAIKVPCLRTLLTY